MRQTPNMYLRAQNGWELWGGTHPASIGCFNEGREICDCAYHILNNDRTQIESFEDYASADTRYQELSGAQPLTVGNPLN